MVAFNQRRGISGNRNAFDNVRIKRTLGEEIYLAYGFYSFIEHFDKSLSNNFALSLGVFDTGEALGALFSCAF